MDAAAEVVMEMARGCGAAGWITNLMTIHNFQASMFPLQAQEEYFADGVPFCSTASRPLGSSMTDVKGGVRLSGRWKYASGSDFADWFIIMQPVPGNLNWLMIPREDVSLQHDWEVAGLVATGSQDIVVDDVFVPHHRMLAAELINAGTTPARDLYDSPFLRVPFFIPAGCGISAAVIGMVAGMIEEYSRATATRRLMTGGMAAAQGYNQRRLAEAEVRLSCARHLVRGALARIRSWGENGIPEDPAELMMPRRDYAYAAQLMTETAQHLYVASGAGAAFLANPIQRLTRDALVGGTHLTLNWDEAAEAYGQARWNMAGDH